MLADKFANDVEKAILDLEAHGIKFAAILFDDIFSSDGVFADPSGFIKKAIDISTVVSISPMKYSLVLVEPVRCGDS